MSCLGSIQEGTIHHSNLAAAISAKLGAVHLQPNTAYFDITFHFKRMSLNCYSSDSKLTLRYATGLSEHPPSALLDEKKRRIWCFGPNPDSKV